jgi:hypothetical protein
MMLQANSQLVQPFDSLLARQAATRAMQCFINLRKVLSESDPLIYLVLRCSADSIMKSSTAS